MQNRRCTRLFAVLAVAAFVQALPSFAQDRNIVFPVGELESMLETEPLRIVSAEISRPGAEGDITLRADVAFGERPQLRVKLRHAQPGADTFNNVPRYDLAAYELQKLLVESTEYLVPPTAVRMVPLEELRVFAPNVRSTFTRADDVLCVVQYWLQDVESPVDVLDAQRFEADAVYARHIGQLNVLTYLIAHADSNRGNFLVSAEPAGARVFAIDNGVAFDSEPSDRGELWRSMRVQRLPADTVARLRALTREELLSRLGVLAQWELRDSRYVAVSLTANRGPNSGVRNKDGVVQMGLTRREILDVWERAQELLQTIDEGTIATF